MRVLLKKIYFGTIKIFQSIVSILSVLFFNKYGVNRKIRSLSKSRGSSIATVLANGPSMKEIVKTRMDLIEGTDVIAMNYFGNTEDFFRVKPKYYILIDPAFFDPNWVVTAISGDTGSWGPKEKMQANFEKVDWGMKLFLPITSDSKKNAKHYLNNKNIEVVWIHGTRIAGFDCFQKWMYKHNQGLPSSSNVLIPAMLLMANIGYNKIYLYGAEFSWTKTMDVDVVTGRLYENDKHFYSRDEMRFYNKGGYKFCLEGILDSLMATEQVEKYARSQNVTIINRTKGSFIDAFIYENPDNITIKNA